MRKKLAAWILGMVMLFPSLAFGQSGIGESYITFKQRTVAPPTPASAYNRIYFKTDGKLYYIGSAGSETEVGTGAAATTGTVTDTTDTTAFVALYGAVSGDLPFLADSALTYNATTGLLSTTGLSVSGPVTLQTYTFALNSNLSLPAITAEGAILISSAEGVLAEFPACGASQYIQRNAANTAYECVASLTSSSIFLPAVGTALTITGNDITVTQSNHKVEGTGPLKTINGYPATGGMILRLQFAADTVIDETENINVPNGSQVTASSGYPIYLSWNTTTSKWDVWGVLPDSITYDSFNVSTAIVNTQCTGDGEPDPCCTDVDTGTCGTYPISVNSTEVAAVAEGQFMHRSDTDVTTIGDGTAANELLKTAKTVIAKSEYLPIRYGESDDTVTAPAAAEEINTTSTMIGRAFDKDADEGLVFWWQVPLDYSAGVKYRVYYSPAVTASTTNLTAVFALSGCSVGNSDAIACSEGTAINIADELTQTTDAAGDLMVTGWSDAVTVTNITAGEIAKLLFIRDISEDDYTDGDILVTGIEIKYQAKINATGDY